jgi:hypothetical protein
LKRLFLLLVAVVALLVPAVGHAAPGPVLNFYAPNATTPAITSFDFGAVLPGQSVEKTFTLRNDGGSATSALAVTLTRTAGAAAAFTKTGDTCTQPIPISLAKAKTCQITIRFAPGAGGEVDKADLKAMSKKPAASATLKLTGTGAAPNVVISPASWSFGTLGKDQIFTATNTGTATSGPYAFDPPGAPFFNFTNINTCTGAALAPGGHCSFTIRYEPSTCTESSLPGAPYSDAVALGSLASVSLTATQPHCPHLSVSPSPHDFGTASGSHSFNFRNDGNGPAFIVGGFASWDDVFTVGGTCGTGTTLQPGEVCSTIVTFTQAEGCGATYDGIRRWEATLPGHWGGTFPYTEATAIFTAAQPACVPDLTIDPASWDFGTESGTKTFTVKNEGTAASTLFFVHVEGYPVFADAVGSTCDGSLQPGEECLFNVSFLPADECGGTYFGDFTVTESATGITTAATLTGAQPECLPDLTLSPGALSNGTYVYNFGSGLRTETFTVTNNGPGSTGTLSLFYTVLDPRFALLNDNCSGHALAENETCTFQLQFVPQTACPSGTDYYQVISVQQTSPVPKLFLSLFGLGHCP